MYFFSVTTRNNLESLIKSVNFNLNFYDVTKYTIICPTEDVNIFRNEIKSEKVEVLDENQIISIKDFKTISSDIAVKLGKEEINIKRVSWYYQQVLKLSYSLSKKGRVVMWDADTVPIKKIMFFKNEDLSTKFGGDIEYHEAYFTTLNLISNYVKPKYAYTIQFYSHTENERQRLLGIIKNFIPDYSKYKFSEAISMLVLNSIYNQNLDFKKENSSYFSEQEFIGCFKNDDKIQSRIKHFRPGRFWNASKHNTALLNIFGYSYFTVETNNILNNDILRSLYFYVFLISDALKITKIRRLISTKGDST